MNKMEWHNQIKSDWEKKKGVTGRSTSDGPMYVAIA